MKVGVEGGLSGEGLQSNYYFRFKMWTNPSSFVIPYTIYDFFDNLSMSWFIT